MSSMFKIKRDIIIHVILKTNKTRHKIKYFCLFEIFQCFWIFFFFNKNQSKKQNNQKQKTKHVHKQLKELNQGQVSNTHLGESFLTHIARVFSFVGENPCEAECI